MAPEQVLDRRLARATHRLRLVLAWRWGLRAVAAALVVCLAWSVMSRMSLVSVPRIEWVVGLLVGAVLLSIGVVLLLRLPPMSIARLVDGRAGTRDRLASAVELRGQVDVNPLVGPLLGDAADCAARVDLRRAMPFRGWTELAAVVLLGAALFGLYFMPQMPLFWSKEKKAEVAAVRVQGANVEKLAREAEQLSKAQSLPSTTKAARQLRALAAKMKRGELDRKASLVVMHKLTRKMEAEQRRLAMANGASKSMEQAAAEARAALERKSEAVAQANRASNAGKLSALDKRSAKPASEKTPSETSQRAQQAMRKFAEAMANQDGVAQEKALQELADQLEKGGLTKSEAADLQQQLSKVAQAMKGSRLDSASKEMAKLAQSMQCNGLKFNPQNLRRCTVAMRKLAGMCKTCSKGVMDAKQLAMLTEAMKRGDMRMIACRDGGKHAGLAYIPNQDQGKRVKLTSAPPNTRISGQRGAGKEAAPTVTYMGAADRNASSGSPYYQVAAQQRKAMEGAVSRDSVPAPYRQQVRDYFDAIRP